MNGEDIEVLDSCINATYFDEQSIDINWISAVETLHKIQQESHFIHDSTSNTVRPETLHTCSEFSSLQPPQTAIDQLTKSSSNKRELVSPFRDPPSSSSSSSSSSSNRPMRAARLVKTDFFVAEPAICAIRVKSTKRKERTVEENVEETESKKQHTQNNDEESMLNIKFEIPQTMNELKLFITGQTYTISSSQSDTDTRIKALVILFGTIEKELQSARMIRDSGAYETILEILGSSLEDEVVYRSMRVLNVTITSDSSVARYLVEVGVVPLVLPLCSSNCTRVRLEALWIIHNIGASEHKGAVVTLEVVQAIAQSYASSDSLAPIATDTVSCYYGRVLHTLTKNCSQEYAHMMVLFIPVLKLIIFKTTSVKEVEYSCAACANLLKAKDAKIVDEILKENVVYILLKRLDDKKVKIVWFILNLLIDISDTCNSQQILQLQSVVKALYGMIHNYCCVDASVNKKTILLAIDCIGSIAQVGPVSVAMIIRTAPTLYGNFVWLVQEGLEMMRFPGSREDQRTVYAVSAMMKSISSVAPGDNLLYFIDLGCYPLAFAVLQTFKDDKIVQETLRALSSVITKLPNIAGLQQDLEVRNVFNATAAWKEVWDLIRKPYGPLELLQNAQQLLNSAMHLQLTRD